MALVMNNESPRPCSQTDSVDIRSGRASWAARLHPPPPALRSSRTDPDLAFYGIDLTSFDGVQTWKDLDKFAELGLTLDAEEEDEYPVRVVDFPRFSLEKSGLSPVEEVPRVVKPFHKWMKTLQRRAQHRSKTQASTESEEPFPEFLDDDMSYSGHRKSSSESSFGYVTGVKSASVSMAGSVMTRSRRDTARSSHYARTDRSSRASMSAERRSEDSVRLERIVTDPAVTERLLQRRRILEELISTEESYIGDIKFLMNVYVTILASLPTQHPGLRSSINRNLTDIVELHEEILGDLHRTVPNSEYTQIEQLPTTPRPASKPSHHQRWRSLDSVPEDKGGISWLQNVPGMTAEPDVAADVARVFRERMHRFFVYEEYGAKYEMMIRDVASAHRTMPQWETYQKGLEALAASLGAVNRHSDRSRKSLTIGDLLVKPIQRICKYPLLFAELLKYTPVYDCPNAHAEIEEVLVRLREATSEINRATDDPSVKVTMEKTWLLQDRLVFPNQSFDAALKTTVRSLGQIQLCGALHVCWQTRDGADGQYMICLLYKEYLCLATASKVDQIYTVQACIGLNTIKIEEADNGRGLQCHTAPFSWKIIFEPEGGGRVAISSRGLDPERSTGPNGATTVQLAFIENQKPRDCLWKTGDSGGAGSESPINRSQSLLTTTARIPVLAPSRSERARIEALLTDVWSRKVLPFPGITTRARSEHLVRTSASTMMRKLSVASITNSFSKRSTSSASLNTIKASDEEPAHGDNFADPLVALNCDFSSSALNIDQALDDIQRLPVIRDEIERASTCSRSMRSTDGGTLSGTVRKLDISKLDPDAAEGPCLVDDTVFGGPILRASSANSTPPPRAASPSLKPTCSASSSSSAEKENNSQSKSAKRPVQETAGHAKSANKRSKVGAINRGLVAGAIRSFFR
ncbi:hypothetical protein JX265_008933 [Neoarthrinium moseri]|uniref:DH domain-containing protein n=1 Tax=Neoarthrinium moseri TaxID=1658444 RepID=A0A9P9WH01_9PEZI|nr:hypothetical protein JX265_008933 [Neoarthrinium moseri]